MKKIFILAGEPSGDIHAARLMIELKKLIPDIEFIGIGGIEMTKAGLKSIIPLNEISVVGFWEVAKKYSLFRKLLNQCQNLLENENVDAFIPVDYPGFNLRLSEFAKKKDIPVIYYIAPQLWAWGRNRANNIKQRVDKLLVVFPFEVEFFGKFGIEAEFVGHPLLDDPVFPETFPSYEEREFRLALLPGSRKQEVARHMPVLSETVKLLKIKYPDLQIGLAASGSIEKEAYDNILNKHPDWDIWDNSRELLKSSLTGIIKTGTSNLEAALCGLPFTMFYKTSGLSYQLSKKLINLPYISIINIILNRPMIRELIQADATPQNISDNTSLLIDNKDKYMEFQQGLLETRHKLGDKGASKRAALVIKEML